MRRMMIGLLWLGLAGLGTGCGGSDADGNSLGEGGDGDGDGATAGDGDGTAGDGGGDGDGDTAGVGIPPTFAPSFPGAGTDSTASAPLQNGMLCDYVPKDGDLPTPNESTTCFFGMNGDPVPAATLEQVLECVDGQDVVHLRLTFNPDFVDNTYGENSIGWSPVRGHRFRDLTGSDHAELLIQNADGDVVLQFKLDYITEDLDSPSGYGSLGVSGGDGSVSVGDPGWIVDYATSLDRNLNERGYGEYTMDSPATDENFTPNPDTPEWDYRMVYEVWIDVAALGDQGFGGAFIEYVHASPAKSSNDTIEVTPGECPPETCTDPDACYTGDPPPTDEECGDQPDELCGGEPPPPPTDEETCGDQPDELCSTGEPGDPPQPGDPGYCDLYPDDEICKPQ